MKASRPRVAMMAGLTITTLAITTLATAACSTMTPTPINTPYDAADGVSATVTYRTHADPKITSVVKLEDILVVSSRQNAPGALIGAVVNEGHEPTVVEITVTAADGTTSLAKVQVAVPAGSLTKLGPDAVALTVPQMPAAPGALIQVTAKATGGEPVSLRAPILTPTQQYSSITPAATPPAACSRSAAVCAATPTGTKPA